MTHVTLLPDNRFRQIMLQMCPDHPELTIIADTHTLESCSVCGKPKAYQYFREFADGRTHQSSDGMVWIDVTDKVD